DGTGDSAEIAAAKRMVNGDRPPAGIAFLDSRTCLEPDALAILAEALAQNDRLGIMSTWARESRPQYRGHIQPVPTAPYLWHDDELAPCIVVTTAAFNEAQERFNDGASASLRRSMLDSIVRSGREAVTYPAVLCSVVLAADDSARQPGRMRYSSM